MNSPDRKHEQFNQRQAEIDTIKQALNKGNLGVNSLNGQTGREWTRGQWEQYLEGLEKR